MKAHWIVTCLMSTLKHDTWRKGPVRRRERAEQHCRRGLRLTMGLTFRPDTRTGHVQTREESRSQSELSQERGD